MTSSVHIIWTLVLLLLFVGIVLWAWSTRRHTDFEEAARLPLDDDLNHKSTTGCTNNG